MTTRCTDGRLMRHDPQPDDPSLETDIGKCPDCDGKGCCQGVEAEHLERLATHLERLDSGSQDAKAIRWALDAIEHTAAIATKAHDKWEECLNKIDRQKEHIAGLQAALRTVQREQAET
jgi:excinuclease UvrABC ATPase subunit